MNLETAVATHREGRIDRQGERGDGRKVDDICRGVNIYVFARTGGEVEVQTEIVLEWKFIISDEYRNPRRGKN